MIINYRKVYKKWYGIELDDDFDIHHLDFNHKNNDMSNLLLLPKELHRKYHQLLNTFGHKNGIVDFKLDVNVIYRMPDDAIKEFCDVMVEIKKWIVYKQNLELEKRYMEF